MILDAGAVAAFTQAGAGAVPGTVQDKIAQVLSVEDFGARASKADNTAAAQLAINEAVAIGTTFGGTEIYVPNEYKIGGTLVVPQNKHVSWRGRGRSSGFRWVGGNNASMLSYAGGNAGPDCKAYVQGLAFLVPGQTGVTAIASGSNAVGFGNSNLTVRGCCFQNVDVALETFSETDMVVFNDNWLLSYYTAGVRASGGTSNSGYMIRDNHFQGGFAGSLAVDHTGGSTVRVDGNIIESGTAGMKGIRLNAVADFAVVNNYYEVSAALGAADGPFLDLIGSTNGDIRVNHTTGDTGNQIIKVDGACWNIGFGPNRHGVSGGTPTTFVAVAAGATDIFLYGKQDGALAEYTGVVSTHFAGNVLTATKPVNEFNAFQNVGAAATASIVTLAASTAYRVYVKNGTDNYFATADVTRTAAGNAIIGNYYTSNAALALTVSGNDLQVTNGAGAVRTIEYSAMRMF